MGVIFSVCDAVPAIAGETGLAVMLAAFGPAVLLLYQQRLERLRPHS